LEKDIAEDVNATLSPIGRFRQCCGMHLITPSESEYKEKIRENLIAVSKKDGTGRNSLSRKGSRY
jgi:hypothetical protein